MGEETFVQVFYKEYSDVVTRNFKYFLDHDLYIDVIFICGDRKKVKAHQLVIGFFSRFLYDIFFKHQQKSTGKVTYINLPDVSSTVMEHIIQFVYSGKTTITSSSDLKEFREDMVFLGMPSCSLSPTNEKSFLAIAKLIPNKMDETLYQPVNAKPPFLASNEDTMKKNSYSDSSDSCEKLSLYSCGNELTSSSNPSQLLEVASGFTHVISANRSVTDKIPIISKEHLSNNESHLGTSNIFADADAELIKNLARNLFVQFQKLKHKTRRDKKSKIISTKDNGKNCTKESADSRTIIEKNFKSIKSRKNVKRLSFRSSCAVKRCDHCICPEAPVNGLKP